MSEENSKSASPATTHTPSAPAPTPVAGALADLMAAGAKGGAKPADKAGKPNLEADALRAAEQALAEGERALAAARSHLHVDAQAPPTARSRKRELALRALLVVNVVAMVAVSMLPAPGESATSASPASEQVQQPQAPIGVMAHRFDEPWARALTSAEGGDFAAAIATLERYLADNPRMQAGQRASVLNSLAYYASRTGDWKRSADFTRQFEMLKGSHSLPDDLVQEAKAALESGDQEKLRRTWARFLLQQKQIPTWLYKHVAEAYLQLGDSYRKEAAVAAEAQRLQDLQTADAKLREAAMQTQERGK